MLDKFLDLLFKCKPVFKAFVWCDYVVRSNHMPYKIRLTNDRTCIIIENKFGLCQTAFYKKSWRHYEMLD